MILLYHLFMKGLPAAGRLLSQFRICMTKYKKLHSRINLSRVSLKCQPQFQKNTWWKVNIFFIMNDGFRNPWSMDARGWWGKFSGSLRTHSEWSDQI
jgi:hypothetical protein